jgi:O-acetylserine/cysteine efflux transporter
MPVRHLIMVLIVCLAWSFNFTAGAAGMQHFPPLLFMILRFLLILAVLLPFLRLPPPGQWFLLTSVCLLVGSLHFSIMFWALARSNDVSSVAIVQQTYIPMAVILAVLLLGERIGWRTALATFFAFIGVLVIGLDPLVLTQLDVLGLALFSAFFQALGSIYMRKIRGVGVMNFQAWTAIISLPVLILFSFALEQDQLLVVQSATLLQWGSVIYSGLIASIIGHGLFFYLVQKHPVTTVMPYMLLTPLFAVVFGVTVWGDQPGWKLLFGGLMVLLGIFIITLRARQKSLSPVQITGESA